MKNTTINIVNIIGDQYAVEAEDGQKVYSLILKSIENKHKIIVSFLNVELLTTAFLNTAFGQLYRDYNQDQIRNYVEVIDISASGKVALKRVVETAKQYYQNPKAFQEKINQIMED